MRSRREVTRRHRGRVFADLVGEEAIERVVVECSCRRRSCAGDNADAHLAA